MFILDIQLGSFLLIVFFTAEVLIALLKNLFAGEILHCAARHAVAKGRQIQVRPAPALFHAFAIEKIITSKGVLIYFVSAVKYIIAIFLITSIALWERTIEAETVQQTVELSTTAVFKEDFRAPQGKTYLVSPFPITGLSEEDAGPLEPFSGNGTKSNANYRVRENIGLANMYSSACVKTPNSTHTIVSIGALMIDHNGTRRTSCLDGSGASTTSISASFETGPDEDKNGKDLSSVEILRKISTYRPHSLLAGLAKVYAAEITDENGAIYKGYVALTSRSYFNANVEWSMYGLLRNAEKGGEIWRLNLPLVPPLDGGLEDDYSPCGFKEIGIWKVRKRRFRCPSFPFWVPRYRDPDRIKTKPLTTAGLLLNTPQTGEENSDLLAWMIETDYSRFSAARTFAEELRGRVRSDRMFYSAFDGRRVVATTGLMRESVSFGKTETILLVVAVSFLILQILFGIIWKRTQVRKYNMRSEIVSYDAIATMYQHHVSGLDVENGTRILRLGICNGQEGSQCLGIVSKGETVPRDTKKSWGKRMGCEDCLNGAVFE